MDHAVAWVRREPPLPPTAVVGTDEQSPGLRSAVVTALRGGAQLRVCIGDGWLLALGVEEELPWAEGVSYLAWQSGLLLPTTLAVLPGADLLRAAVRRELPEDHDVVVVLPHQVLAAPMPRSVPEAGVLETSVPA